MKHHLLRVLRVRSRSRLREKPYLLAPRCRVCIHAYAQNYLHMGRYCSSDHQRRHQRFLANCWRTCTRYEKAGFLSARNVDHPAGEGRALRNSKLRSICRVNWPDMPSEVTKSNKSWTSVISGDRSSTGALRRNVSFLSRTEAFFGSRRNPREIGETGHRRDESIEKLVGWSDLWTMSLLCSRHRDETAPRARAIRSAFGIVACWRARLRIRSSDESSSPLTSEHSDVSVGPLREAQTRSGLHVQPLRCPCT